MGGPSTAQREEQDAEAAVAGLASSKAAGSGIHKATGGASRLGKAAGSAMSNRNPQVKKHDEKEAKKQQQEDSVPKDNERGKDGV
ncbi:hypothetical protein [Rhodothalassium salexigens]|nr:hypothetical protein [Rhodothalassium salexigens]MBB4212717.1 hypothetical protein [Rhodothalassium salexigens DSM 2132]